MASRTALDYRTVRRGGRHRPDGLTVLDTSELRWFAPGSLPPDVRRWFAGATGVAADRCDTYRLDGRADVGVKLRFGTTPELKVRQGHEEHLELDEELRGAPEMWRRWSPAPPLRGNAAGSTLIDVHKSVVKRRFTADGTETDFVPSPHPTGIGCDVEVAEVAVGDERSWTFALAAFGPRASRRDALAAAWRGLLAASPCAMSVRPPFGRAMGYPEWLLTAVGCTGTPASEV